MEIGLNASKGNIAMTNKTKKNEASISSDNKNKKTSAPSHEQVAERAYKLWQENGGLELDNWLEAERQLF